jgi:hypothetical protein
LVEASIIWFVVLPFSLPADWQVFPAGHILKVTFFNNLNVHQQRDPTAWTAKRGIY